MERSDVYVAIDGERDYQKARWGQTEEPEDNPQPRFDELVDRPKDVGTYLTIMRDLAVKADNAIAPCNTDTPALHQIRKLVAVGVACLEQHGVPPRKYHPSIENAYLGYSITMPSQQ